MSGTHVARETNQVPPGFNPNGTRSWPALHVNRGRVDDPALEMMGPAPDRFDPTMGSQLIELVDPLEKSTDRT